MACRSPGRAGPPPGETPARSSYPLPRRLPSGRSCVHRQGVNESGSTPKSARCQGGLPRPRAPARSHRGDDADGACLRTLRPVLHLVLHLRPLSEALEALAADRAVVDEDVLATVVLRDEAVALVVVEPLDGSGCHISHLPRLRHERAAERRWRKSPNRYSL